MWKTLKFKFMLNRFDFQSRVEKKRKEKHTDEMNNTNTYSLKYKGKLYFFIFQLTIS